MRAAVADDWVEPVRHCFEFPVHVCGYNWTASNRDSGAELAKYIDGVIEQYKKMGRLCDQVILITHSMGGLDARSACMRTGRNRKCLALSMVCNRHWVHRLPTGA